MAMLRVECLRRMHLRLVIIVVGGHYAIKLHIVIELIQTQSFREYQSL
jgi:hypothetical protein